MSSDSLTNLTWICVSTPQNTVNGVHNLSIEGCLLIGKVPSTKLNESLDGLTSNGNILTGERFSNDLQQEGYLTDKVDTL